LDIIDHLLENPQELRRSKLKEKVKQIADKYGATLTYETTTDDFWKYEKQVARLTDFKTFFDKLYCQGEITDVFLGAKLDATIRGQYNPDIVIIEWRE
jgi:hypothetical protein